MKVDLSNRANGLLSLKDLGLLNMRKEGKKFVFTPVVDLAEKLEG